MRLYPARFAVVATLLGIAPLCTGTSVPRLSSSRLIDTADVVASGTVVRSWSAWDSAHRMIWTHYLLEADVVSKGAAASGIEIAEPGGELNGQGVAVPGAVTYRTGEKVLVFLQRMPNQYLRTAGWSQGKYTIDARGRVRAAAAPAGLQIVAAGASAAEPVISGKTAAEVHAMVRARGARTAK